jgi:hypothetical protein
MYFDNEDEQFPYSCLGSCFIVRYRQKLWIATAKHVIAGAGYQVSQAMAPYSLASGHFIPIRGAYAFDDIPDHPEATDVIAFEIDEALLDRAMLDVSAVHDLDSQPAIPPSLANYRIIVHGFPDELNEVDYETKKLYRVRLSIMASDPQTGYLTGCVRIQLMSDGTIADARGFSGGPVFLVPDTDGTDQAPRLWGIITNGSIESKIFNFLSIVVFKNLIDHVIQKVS